MRSVFGNLIMAETSVILIKSLKVNCPFIEPLLKVFMWEVFLQQSYQNWPTNGQVAGNVFYVKSLHEKCVILLSFSKKGSSLRDPGGLPQSNRGRSRNIVKGRQLKEDEEKWKGGQKFLSFSVFE